MTHQSDGFEFVRGVDGLLVEEDVAEKNGGSLEKPFTKGDEDRSVKGEELPDEDGDLPQCKIKRNYSCTLCPFFSQNPRSFLYHLRDIHFDRIKIHECSQCLYASKHSQKLQRHISMIHAPGKARGRKKNRGIKAEKRTELRPIKPKPPKPPDPESGYFIKIVAQETQTNSENIEAETESSIEPLRTVDGEYACSVCTFKHKNQKVVRKHERVVHLKRRLFKCGKCSYVTHVTARYTKHVKYHSMPMIKCDLCDFRTPYKWNLDRHYKNHNGKGEFQCSKCNFRADIKQSLTVHETNHHVPPVGQGTVRRRTRAPPANVKLSEDMEEVEEECSGEKNESDVEPIGEVETNEDETPKNLRDVQSVRNVKVPYVSKRDTIANHLQTDFIHPDDIVPRYGQIYVKNLKCKFCSYKAVFNHEIARHEKRIHDYVHPENKKDNSLKRPPPNLIPIQSKTGSSAILKIPSVKNKPGVISPEPISIDKPVNEKEFNEMCKKSSLTSSLKDFVSLIGDEEGLKSIPDSYRDLEADLLPAEDNEIKKDDQAKKEQTDFLKKKNASFFDKLKEKLLIGNSEEQSLYCEVCGHESKCLSESVAHQKRHSSSYKSDSDNHNDIVLTGELSSTRCQHCRQRCKTSTDLINHLKTCKAFEAAQGSCEMEVRIKNEIKEEVEVKDEIEENPEDDKSMENRIFVWNNLNQNVNDLSNVNLNESSTGDEQNETLSTLPGFATVLNNGSDNTESGMVSAVKDPRFNFAVKKVFKCPHCPFWASTASRFHVHIVGHLNRKPFECSLCLYKSNWRWDITKHIRLKSIRDPTHLQAKVNMTDETGKRNYTKYNRFLTMMKVQEASADSSGYGKRTRSNEFFQAVEPPKHVIPLPPPPNLVKASTRPAKKSQETSDSPSRPPPPPPALSPLLTISPTPPPPLQAANHSQADTVKRTFWKCKKCNFRDTHKGRVLVHVKKHYMYKKSESSSILLSSSNDIDPADQDKWSQKSVSYSCGHCHQVSKWKHVVQRHCMLKHGGDTLIEVKVNWIKKPELGDKKPKEEDEKAKENDEEAEEEPGKLFSCDICPFTGRTEGDLTAHKLNHVDRPGSIFKCSYCPFYVPSKTAVYEHMAIHVQKEKIDYTNVKVDNFDPSDRNEDFIKLNIKTGKQVPKRYKCRQCPYLSNSKTQFLYHKQFHKPRNAPYQCKRCSYNVYHRNLLHQHVKVHYFSKTEAVTAPEQKVTPNPTPSVEMKNVDQSSEEQSPGEKDADKSIISQMEFVKAPVIKKEIKVSHCEKHSQTTSRTQEEQEDEDDTPFFPSNLSETEAHSSSSNDSCDSASTLASPMKITRQTEKLMTTLEKEDIEKKSKKVMLPTPENVSRRKTESQEKLEEAKKVLNFCNQCPARFIFEKELYVHLKFHMINLPFRCLYCTYSGRQRPHLLSHYKVHSAEYQKKSVELMKVYPVSKNNPRPRTDTIKKDSHKIKIEGPVWVVPTMKKMKTVNGKQKHTCPRCPQTFFKYLTMRKHLSYHGKNNKFKCSYCDYSVKASSVVLKHQAYHEENTKKTNFMYSFPISGEDLNGEESEGNTKLENKNCDKKLVRDNTKSWKNGKKANKPFKCHLCPSNFEKHKKYLIHLSLHGSEQKYKCKQCDYSVNYHSNYLYHLKSHRIHDAKISRQKKTAKDKLKKQPFKSLENYRKTFRCKFCGYTCNKQERLKLHLKKHFRVSGMRSRHACKYCDYSTAKSSLIKKHNKLHFTPRFIPEAAAKFEKIELWCQEDGRKSKILIFQDKGEEIENRFYPHAERYNEGEEHTVRLYANPETGNPIKKEKIVLEDSTFQDVLMKFIEKEELDVIVRKQGQEENWKCNKCPQVFSKKEQYLNHIELHGSNQSHDCDYPITHNSNYVQYNKLHERHEPSGEIIRKSSCSDEIMSLEDKKDDNDDDDDDDKDSTCLVIDESFGRKEWDSDSDSASLVIDESRKESHTLSDMRENE